MRAFVTLFIILIAHAHAKSTPIIKVEGQELLKALAYTESMPYVKLYDWDMGERGMSPIVWDPEGNNWTPQGFERKGKVYLSNDGNITHHVIEDVKKPGYWELYMLGNKDKITKAVLSPNALNMEKPFIKIDKAYVKKAVVCEEDDNRKKTVYLVKFPQKVSFWMEERRIQTQEGAKSEYVITYDNEPECIKHAKKSKSEFSEDAINASKKQIELFIKSFYKAEEDEFPTKVLKYYDSHVAIYFGKRNFTKEEILEDKVRYYKKWPIRKYAIKDIEIIDTFVKDARRYYKVNVVLDWNVTSAKGKAKSGTSFTLIMLVETDMGFSLKGIKDIGTNKYSSRRTNVTRDNMLPGLNNTKKLKIRENGIIIEVTYPPYVRKGKYFELSVKMINEGKGAKQGGLTLSFPHLNKLEGRWVDYNFNSVVSYRYPDKIYNKNTKKTMKTRYFMIEGWQKRYWYSGEEKHITVKLKVPKFLDTLKVNIRGVLWITNSRHVREIPTYSIKYDQQGYFVKQIEIPVVE